MISSALKLIKSIVSKVYPGLSTPQRNGSAVYRPRKVGVVCAPTQPCQPSTSLTAKLGLQDPEPSPGVHIYIRVECLFVHAPDTTPRGAWDNVVSCIAGCHRLRKGFTCSTRLVRVHKRVALPGYGKMGPTDPRLTSQSKAPRYGLSPRSQVAIPNSAINTHVGWEWTREKRSCCRTQPSFVYFAQIDRVQDNAR